MNSNASNTTTTARETNEDIVVRHVASLLAQSAGGGGPFDITHLRWGLSRIGSPAFRDPLRFASMLIDETLRQYDADASRFAVTPPPLPVCYSAPCSPDSPCVAEFGSGVTIRHAPATGHWIVDGVVYPSDRREAERAARKLAVLRQLARDLGVAARES